MGVLLLCHDGDNQRPRKIVDILLHGADGGIDWVVMEERGVRLLLPCATE